jgi:hypothetical protein
MAPVTIVTSKNVDKKRLPAEDRRYVRGQFIDSNFGGEMKKPPTYEWKEQ